MSGVHSQYANRVHGENCLHACMCWSCFWKILCCPQRLRLVSVCVYTVMVQVQPGDILESVDGMRVHGWKMADILRMIVGEDDSFVTLGITRGQEV